MSLSTGRGPLSGRPAGRFTAPVPDPVAYLEPFRRRVRAVKDGRTVVDSEQVLALGYGGSVRVGDWEDLATADAVVVCAGGGGVPVVRSESGKLQGVEAVIDKDLATLFMGETTARCRVWEVCYAIDKRFTLTRLYRR